MRASPISRIAWHRSGGSFDFDAKAERLEEGSREVESPDVWDNPQRAQDVGGGRARLERIVVGIRSLADSLAEAGDLLDLAIAEGDESTAGAVAADVESLGGKVDKLEFQPMFSGEMDSANAFVDIQAGA